MTFEHETTLLVNFLFKGAFAINMLCEYKLLWGYSA